MRLLLFALAAMGLVVGAAFAATTCSYSSECDDDEMCVNGFCEPNPYSASVSCCGPSSVLLLVSVLAAFVYNEKRLAN